VHHLEIGNEPFIFDVTLLLVRRTQDRGKMNGGRDVRRAGIGDELPALFELEMFLPR
jgi:hypothetical protein